MNRALALFRALLDKPFVKYVFVGGSTVILDVSLLVVLHEIVDLNLALATTLSYWSSIVYNFALNRWWTFGSNDLKHLHKHLASYLLLLGFNYVFTLIVVTQLSYHIDYVLAKVLAICAQITWTFYIYSNHIFVKK